MHIDKHLVQVPSKLTLVKDENKIRKYIKQYLSNTSPKETHFRSEILANNCLVQKLEILFLSKFRDTNSAVNDLLINASSSTVISLSSTQTVFEILKHKWSRLLIRIDFIINFYDEIKSDCWCYANLIIFDAHHIVFIHSYGLFSILNADDE